MYLKELNGKFTKSVLWHEGVLLSPHHFQQEACYQQQYVNCLVKASNYFSYGVTKLVIDNAALISGVLRILEIEAILKDGSYIVYSQDSSPIKYERDIKNDLKSNKITKIYISVPIHKSGQSNFSGEVPRYISVKESGILDENTGENELDIIKKEIKFYIHLDSDLSTKFSSIPIAEITSANTGIQRTNYIEPLIFVNQESALNTLVRTIVQIIKQKIGYIIGKKNFLSKTPNLEEKLYLLIIAALPIEALVNTHGVKPFDLYSKLLNLASTLIALTHGDIIPEIPPYIHEELYKTFYGLQALITQGLDKVIDTSSSIPFMLEDDVFYIKLEHGWVKDTDESINIGIRKSPEATYNDFVNWVNGLQITSRPFIHDVTQRRVLGANRKIATNLDAISTISDNVINLSIDAHSTHIIPGEDICIFNKADKRVADEIVLFIKDESK